MTALEQQLRDARRRPPADSNDLEDEDRPPAYEELFPWQNYKVSCLSTYREFMYRWK